MEESSRQVIVKIVNSSGEAQPVTIQLSGIGGVRPRGSEIVLSGNSPEDENSFAEPKKVAPVLSTLRAMGPRTEYLCRPYSLTVLRWESANR